MSDGMNEFSVSDKASTKEGSSSDGGAIDLGVKLQRTESFPNCKMMMGRHDNHHRPIPSHGAGRNGPTPTCNMIRARSSDIYDVVASKSATAAAVNGGEVGVKTLQPFDIPSTKTTINTASTTHTVFKPPPAGAGGIMASSLGFPFTHAQWKELERQAMIYKYMMASVPVPPDLLIPITRNPPVSASSHSPLGSGLNLRFSRGGELEPGRCRRTDGKKWRCSRDVAPDQKYCERHMHRGRPRSRKHVELAANFNNNNINNKKTRHDLSLPASPRITMALHNNNNTSSCPSQLVGTLSQPFHNKASAFESVASIQSYKEPRSLDWMMTTTTDQQWQNLMQQQTRRGLTSESPFCTAHNDPLLNGYQPLNLNSYANITCVEDEQSNGCSFFLNPDMVLDLDRRPDTETPRGFIDAWSNGRASDDQGPNSATETYVPSNGKLSLSSLTLSMGGNNSIDKEMGQIQMGLGLKESSNQDHECGTKSHLSNWLAPSSWATSSTPGGPLAEVLRSSSVASAAASNPQSPIAENGESGSPAATTVSSPSGVLQRTLASLSDSSGNSSPNFGSSRAKPEMALLWLNQDKVASSSTLN